MTLLEVFEPLKRFANVKLLSHQDLRHIVRMAYLVYLDREPDPEGVKNYITALRRGMSIESLILTISSSDEAKKKAISADTRDLDNGGPIAVTIMGTTEHLTRSAWDEKRRQIGAGLAKFNKDTPPLKSQIISALRRIRSHSNSKHVQRGTISGIVP